MEKPGRTLRTSSTEDSSGEYYVTVVMVSTEHDLETFSYFLKDASGNTYDALSMARKRARNREGKGGE